MERGKPETVTTRRSALGLAAAALSSGLAPRIALGRTYRTIPQRASARVIVDNDFAGDPDGLVALLHQLLSPKTRTVLVTSTALEPRFAEGQLKTRAAALGREAALDLIRRARIKSAPPVVAGAEYPVPADPRDNMAARAIVAEALRDDPLLRALCGEAPADRVACLRQLWEVRLNGQALDLSGFAPAERRDLGMRGLAGWVDLRALNPGPQVLEVRWRPASLTVTVEDYVPEGRTFHIPFVYAPQ